MKTHLEKNHTKRSRPAPLLLMACIYLGLSNQVISAQNQVGGDIDGEASSDRFGYSVALSSDGGRVAIGATLNDGTATSAGHVRVYDLVGDLWTQVGGDIDGEGLNDRFGESLALSSDGSRVAIGATMNDGASANAANAGHVQVYDLVGGAWTQMGADIDGEASLDFSGYSVALSSDGSRVAIGARLNDGTTTRAGHVRIYDLVGGAWTQVGEDINGEAAFDFFGWSVALSSDGIRVAIGAGDNDGTADGAGHVRVYDLVGGAWTQVGSDIDGEALGDQSGFSVDLSSDGSRVAIGAPGNDGTADDAGHVRVYDLVGGVWTQVGGDIDGEVALDASGWSVALSSEGSRVVIGASGNDGTGRLAGHVRVYDFVGGVWTQLGGDIDGEAAGDRSGWSVALSTDGSRVAIGAYRNNGTAPLTGHVRVYDLDMILPTSHSQELEVLVNLPSSHLLSKAYPNPFSKETRIELTLATGQHVQIDVFDGVGRLVRSLHDGQLSERTVHAFRLSSGGLPGGVYIYRVIGDNFRDSGTMLLSK